MNLCQQCVQLHKKKVSYVSNRSTHTVYRIESWISFNLICIHDTSLYWYCMHTDLYSLRQYIDINTCVCVYVLYVHSCPILNHGDMNLPLPFGKWVRLGTKKKAIWDDCKSFASPKWLRDWYRSAPTFTWLFDRMWWNWVGLTWL